MPKRLGSEPRFWVHKPFSRSAASYFMEIKDSSWARAVLTAKAFYAGQLSTLDVIQFNVSNAMIFFSNVPFSRIFKTKLKTSAFDILNLTCDKLISPWYNVDGQVVLSPKLLLDSSQVKSLLCFLGHLVGKSLSWRKFVVVWRIKKSVVCYTWQIVRMCVWVVAPSNDSSPCFSTHIILYLPKFRNWMVPVAAENFGLCLFDVWLFKGCETSFKASTSDWFQKNLTPTEFL